VRHGPLPATGAPAMSPADPVQADPAVGKSRGCWVVGCLALLALVVIPGTVLWGLIAVADDGGKSEPQHRIIEHPLPAGQGLVILRVRMAEVDVIAGPPGSPLRLEGDWDGARYRLEERLTNEPGGTWIYRLQFGGKGLALFAGHGHNRDASRLRLRLPRDHRLSIEGKVSLGESELALGGLSLAEVDLDLGAGSHRISFLEPTAQPLDLLRLDGSVGEIRVLGAGNASPKLLELHHGMGELLLDLSGRWRNDGDVTLRLGMGDSEVQLPGRDEAGAIVDHARVSIGDRQVFDEPTANLPAGLPRVHIRATGGMGELTIQ